VVETKRFWGCGIEFFCRTFAIPAVGDVGMQKYEKCSLQINNKAAIHVRHRAEKSPVLPYPVVTVPASPSYDPFFIANG